ncbi:MAG: transglutaminase domain-containing protein [Bacteroidetes bacterium]|nr:transglutaminase domain-containing protein [Bacteroidota bacterium]
MRKKFILLIFAVLIGQFMFAQKKLPAIKATSPLVDIKDGETLQKGTWKISPKIKPDIYITSNENKRVTFYTDIDSISYKIKPNKTFSFIILLNNKDSAYTQIKYKPSYLKVLKNAGKYDLSDNRSINKFTYKSTDNPELKTLRNNFKLDSIAGSGNEISKFINLLQWVHNTFPYDGSKEVPQFEGIADLMKKSIENRGTMHCGALTWILNDCYLAMGYKSRQVVCLPKDSTDFECHSIVTVYSNSLNKWIWMDPTNYAYVMNELGELLSIAEVRDRLVNDKPLILNPDANLNRKYSITKENYLYSYMAKNLYAFQCFSESHGESKSNLLLPIEYKGIIPRTAVNKPKCTNNPETFWAKPN